MAVCKHVQDIMTVESSAEITILMLIFVVKKLSKNAKISLINKIKSSGKKTLAYGTPNFCS